MESHDYSLMGMLCCFNLNRDLAGNVSELVDTGDDGREGGLGIIKATILIV